MIFLEKLKIRTQDNSSSKGIRGKDKGRGLIAAAIPVKMITITRRTSQENKDTKIVTRERGTTGKAIQVTQATMTLINQEISQVSKEIIKEGKGKGTMTQIIPVMKSIMKGKENKITHTIKRKRMKETRKNNKTEVTPFSIRRISTAGPKYPKIKP